MMEKFRSEENTLHDLETYVMKAWQTVDDINDIYHATETMSEDEIQNALLGLHQISNIRFENLWRVLEQNFALKRRELGLDE